MLVAGWPVRADPGGLAAGLRWSTPRTSLRPIRASLAGCDHASGANDANGLRPREILVVVSPFKICAFGQQQRFGPLAAGPGERHPYQPADGAISLDFDVTVEMASKKPT